MFNFFLPRLQYSVAAIGVGVAGLGYSIYKGERAHSEEKKAESEGNNIRRPFAKIQDEYFQNQNIAKEQATSGLPVDVKNSLQKQRNEGFGTSVDALKQAGGGVNDFSKLSKVFDDSLVNEGAADANQHFANIQYLTGINKDLAGQKNTQWGVNEYQPFESKLKEIQDRRIAAQTNQNNAVNEGIGSLAAISTSINSAVGGPKGGDDGSGGGMGGSNPMDTSVGDSGTDTDIDTADIDPTSGQALNLTTPS
jgi:hypothetical protein